ncbi:MAG: dTMP kinase [Firmicutes bacterium]|nr:dTMP kinase [Bacillota bacterium]
MGLFISMEGPDGSGKTLQMDMLQKALIEAGYPVLRTREPGGPAISERIRALLLDPACKEMSPETEALLYAAARAQHVSQVIKPAMAEGKVVLCDRFVDSSLVYQGIGRGLGVSTIGEINHFATGGLQPDVTIVLQIDYAEGLRRKNVQYSGQLDRMEQQAGSFHQLVHDGFSQIVEWDPERVRMVDGSKAPEEVHTMIMEVLKPWLDRVLPQ